MGGDPAILNKVITGAGFNSARYDDPELSDLLKREIAEMDPEKRIELVNEIQEVYARELPALPLYYPTNYWAHDGKVDLFYTKNGVGSGVPIPLNKMAFLA
jgi:peptide/nickel transport system substrate-binding protein